MDTFYLHKHTTVNRGLRGGGLGLLGLNGFRQPALVEFAMRLPARIDPAVLFVLVAKALKILIGR